MHGIASAFPAVLTRFLSTASVDCAEGAPAREASSAAHQPPQLSQASSDVAKLQSFASVGVRRIQKFETVHSVVLDAVKDPQRNHQKNLKAVATVLNPANADAMLENEMPLAVDVGAGIFSDA